MVKSPQYTIRKLDSLNEEETRQCDSFLGAAFAKDLFTEVITGGDVAVYGPFWRSVMVAGLYGGEIYVAELNGTIIATAVWFGPGRALYDSDEQLEKAWPIVTELIPPKVIHWWETDFLPQYAEFGEEAFGTGVKLEAWHLQLLAVDPQYQRKGIAKALIDTIKQKAALEEESLTLEAEADYNVKIYEKLGFSVKGETQYTGLSGSFPMWGMFQKVNKA